jgi:flavodoxin
MHQSLIIYYSWSGTTRAIAEELQALTGADIFELIPAEAYPDNYNDLVDTAQLQRRSGTRPALAKPLPDLSPYDTLYLGFPNWMGDLPMILYRFLEEADLSGKTVLPWVTSGGSGFSATLDTIARLQPGAVITHPLAVSRVMATNPKRTAADWVQSLKTS